MTHIELFNQFLVGNSWLSLIAAACFCWLNDWIICIGVKLNASFIMKSMVTIDSRNGSYQHLTYTTLMSSCKALLYGGMRMEQHLQVLVFLGLHTFFCLSEFSAEKVARVS